MLSMLKYAANYSIAESFDDTGALAVLTAKGAPLPTHL